MKLTVILKKQDADGLGGEILENMGMTRSSVEDQVFSSYHLAPDLSGIQVGDVDDQMFSARITEALMDHGIRPVRVCQKTNSNAGLTPVSGSGGIESENDDEFSVEDAMSELGLEDEPEEEDLAVHEAMMEAGFISAGRSKYDDPEFADWIYRWLKKGHEKTLQGMKRRGEDPSTYDPAMVFLGSLAHNIEDAFRKERGMGLNDYWNSEYPKKLRRNLEVALDKLHGKGTFKQAVQNNKKIRSSASLMKSSTVSAAGGYTYSEALTSGIKQFYKALPGILKGQTPFNLQAMKLVRVDHIEPEPEGSSAEYTAKLEGNPVNVYVSYEDDPRTLSVEVVGARAKRGNIGRYRSQWRPDRLRLWDAAEAIAQAMNDHLQKLGGGEAAASTEVEAADEGPTVEEALKVLDFTADDLLKDAGFLTKDSAPATPLVTEIQQAKAALEAQLQAGVEIDADAFDVAMALIQGLSKQLEKVLSKAGVEKGEVKEELSEVQEALKSLEDKMQSQSMATAGVVSAGYTHYWDQSRDFTDAEWKKILRGAKSIIQKAAKEGIALGDGGGEGKPELTAKWISLNGAGAESYETFFLSKKLGHDFNFTKTARRPYDPVVVSLLAMAKKAAPDALELSSDGGNVFSNPPIKA